MFFGTDLILKTSVSNMAHLLSLNVFTASKGSNNHMLFPVFIAIVLRKLKANLFRNVELGNDQEMAQSEPNFNSKNRGGGKAKLTTRNLY